MNASRAALWIVCFMILGVSWAPRAASADCATLISCGTSYQTNALLRKLNAGAIWVYAPVPDAPHILFDTQRFRDMCLTAMDVYTVLNEYMPQDYIEQTPYGSGDFTLGWVPMSQILALPNHREGMPLACTIPTVDLPDHPCRMTQAEIYFAVDPNDGYTEYCVAEPSCFTPFCYSGSCGYDIFDFLSLATHEFGHSVGLGHSDDGVATMYSTVFTQDTLAQTLTACEATFIASKYRDNFGPSTLRSFTMERGPANAIACHWISETEVGCRAYRLTRQCPDGVSTLLADSIMCTGPGTVYAVVDTPGCAGIAAYTLSLVDSVAPGINQENVLVVRQMDLGASAPQLRATGVVTDGGDAPQGFATPGEAVEALGSAVTGRDAATRQRVLADGFGYFTIDGLYWGRTIDSILEDELRACLASSDSTVDSLRFIPIQSKRLGDDMEEVTAEVQYVHRCDQNDVTWVGEVVATLERRRVEEGWKVRQIVEMR